MHRLFNLLLCFVVVYALCGCAGSDDAGRRMGQNSALPSRAETKAPSQDPSANVCILDPAAAVAASEACSPAPSTGDGPIVEVPESTYVFGSTIKRDFSHAFVIKNVGTSDLKIKKVLPG